MTKGDVLLLCFTGVLFVVTSQIYAWMGDHKRHPKILLRIGNPPGGAQ